MSKNRMTQTSVETACFSRRQVQAWKLPDFQREDRVNQNIKNLVEQLKKDEGVLPGIITFGVVDGVHYLIDGRQRRNAFLLSEVKECYADVRTCFFATYAEMAEEFISLNSHLVSMKPDDIMRGLEPCVPVLQTIREKCPFVGYDNIRRSERTPVLSMSMTIRSWAISAPDVPCAGGGSAPSVARGMTEEDGDHLIKFLKCAYTAWKNDSAYYQMWSSINLVLCMWLYRRIVLTAHSAKTRRINDAQFTKCLMGLTASEVYCDWLVGRKLGERDRSPAYARIKDIFSKKLTEEFGTKPLLPAPAWSHGTSHIR